MPSRPRPSQRSPIPNRPVLLPGLACFTRSDEAIQLGVEPPHAVVLHGAGQAHARILRAMDGRHDRAGLEQLAGEAGITPPELTELLELLAQHHLLVSFGPRARLVGLDADEGARLSPDLTALALRHTRSDGGAWDTARAVLARRATAWVEVHGAGRVGAGTLALLAAAGVGHVSVVDAGRCYPGDVAPLGLQRQAVGSGRAAAARGRVADVSGSTRTAPPSSAQAPDLCILAPDAGPSASLGASWARRTEPHLVAYVRETLGVVGPLVLPGRTACLRCLDLHRRDRDPAWPRVATQLADGLPRRACDVSLATLVAAQCALQALAFLDGDAVRAMGVTLETADNGAGIRRRAWAPHPDCGCVWAATTVPEQAQRARRTDPATSETMTA